MDSCCYFSIYSMKEIDTFVPKGTAMIRDCAVSLSVHYRLGAGRCRVSAVCVILIKASRGNGNSPILFSSKVAPCCLGSILYSPSHVLWMHIHSLCLSFLFKKGPLKEIENNLILILLHLTTMHLNPLVSGLNKLNLITEPCRLPAPDRLEKWSFFIMLFAKF